MCLALLGADPVPTGGLSSWLGPIFQGAGEIAKGGIAIYEGQQAEKKAGEDKKRFDAEAKQKLEAAKVADRVASEAAARAAVSAASKGPGAAADAANAEVTARAQDRAAAPLTQYQGANEQRIEAAEQALQAAARSAADSPKDTYKLALVRAWQATVNKANAGQIVASDKAQGQGGGEVRGSGDSFWTKKVIGPVPGWGVAAGGVGVVGLGALLLKKFL